MFPEKVPTPLHAALVAALFGLLASGPACAQTSETPPPPPSGQQLEKVEVTGSNISRTDEATADNIQTLTAADIQQSGKETIADLLHSISANFASYNETFSNSFSPGAAGIALRGLSQKNTLVLINGQRIANYGFAQNLEDTYVDLNSIPANAVDHIDILKDGASSIYGSDAIAGVVNVVLRTDYQERVVEAGYGQGPAGNESTRDITTTLGFGSLATDGWNVMLAASYLKRSQVLASEVPFLAGNDFRSHPGGQYNFATQDAYLSDANPGLPQAAFPTCGSGNPGVVLPLTIFPTSATGTICGYNQASQTDEIPQSERTSLVSTGIWNITPTLTGTADIFLANVNTTVTQSPAQLGPTAVVFNPATGGVLTVPNTLPVGNPSNPGATPQDIVYTFNSVGPQDYVVRSNTARLAAGLKGALIGSWDWTANAAVSENDVTQTNYNSILVPALATVIANGSYNFLNPSQTPAANNALRTSFNSSSVSELETIGLKASGDLFSLPAGPLQAAVGYEFRHESIVETPDQLITSGQILGYGSTKVDGSRDVNAVFGELVVPIIKDMEADLAVREEDYSDAGQNFSPKLSLRYQPFSMLVLRGSISAGFRAPSLPEISNASSTAFTSVSDPIDPLGRPSESIAEVIQANPNLKPEKSTNLDLGFVFSPIRDLSLSVDYYRINVRNAVAEETTAQNIVDDPTAYPGQIFRTAGGLLNYVIVPYANLYEISTDGFDIGIQHQLKDLPFSSTFTTELNATILDRLAVNSQQGGPLTNYAGTDGWLYFSPIGGGGPAPRIRGSISGTWENPNWTARLAANYISGYTEVLCALEVGYCGGALPQQEAAAANVGSQTTLDIYGAYKGFKHWTIYGSVLNLLNRRPPFDAYSYPFDITMYDATGRFASIHAEYKF